MGRAAKTLKEHERDGTVPQSQPERPSYVTASRPKFPAHLSREARSEMKRATKILEERGTSSAGDFATLAIYSELYARWVQAKRAIGKQLMIETTVTDNNGNARTVSRLNPLLKVAENCEGRLLPLIKELGLSPRARDSIRQTKNSLKDSVIEGSIAHLYPELVEPTKGK